MNKAEQMLRELQNDVRDQGGTSMSNEIKIESGVPIPPMRSAANNGLWSALDKLKVGQSIVVHGELSTRRSMAGVGNYRFRPRRFTGRTISPTETRIWRIA